MCTTTVVTAYLGAQYILGLICNKWSIQLFFSPEAVPVQLITSFQALFEWMDNFCEYIVYCLCWLCRGNDTVSHTIIMDLNNYNAPGNAFFMWSLKKMHHLLHVMLGFNHLAKARSCTHIRSLWNAMIMLHGAVKHLWHFHTKHHTWLYNRCVQQGKTHWLKINRFMI